VNAASNIPEPLLAFDDKAAEVQAALNDLSHVHARYQAEKQRDSILSNSIEALRLELTYHSNAIEGSTLTLRETQLILDGQAPLGGKPLREIYEARNHDRALRMVEQWAAERAGSLPLSDLDILAVHTQIMTDIDPTSAGRFRSERVLIKGASYIPPGSQKFDQLIPMMLEMANRPGVHPALQTAELHYNFVAIHPFSDGNGRTARLLMNYHLLRRGYPHTIIEFDGRHEYLGALESANAGNPTPFATFIINCAIRSIERLIGAGGEG
jgi:Fic family protein